MRLHECSGCSVMHTEALKSLCCSLCLFRPVSEQVCSWSGKPGEVPRFSGPRSSYLFSLASKSHLLQNEWYKIKAAKKFSCHILAKFRAVKTPFAMHTFDRSKVHLTWRKCCASKSAVAGNSALSEFWMPPNTRPCCTSGLLWNFQALFTVTFRDEGREPR